MLNRKQVAKPDAITKIDSPSTGDEYPTETASKDGFGTFLFLGALPLLAYPFVAMASIMGLAAGKSDSGSILLMIPVFSFYISSLLYPVIYFGALFAGLFYKKRNRQAALKYAAFPLKFLAFILISFVAAFVVG